MPELDSREREVLASFAARVDRNDPGALNNLGVLYYRKGMYGEAIAQFKDALKIDARFDLARENIQYLFAETGTEDPDVSRWKGEVEKDPDNVEALMRLGVSYQNMGRHKEALEILGRVVERKPENFMARLHLGSVLKAQGLYQQALEHYLYAGENVGTSAVYHTDLGEIYYNLGRTDEAISELRSAIKLDAEYWRSHFLLSFAYGDIGQFQDALEESRVASRLNPSFQNTEANLALSDYERQGGDSAGNSMGGDIASLESTSFTLGAAYRERGYTREALKEFNKALAEMADRDRVHIEIGKLHLDEGAYDDAAESFYRALECNAENSEAFRLLGCIYHLTDDFTQAAICYLQAFRLNSADTDTMNNLGVLLYQTGLVEDAERMFKKGLNLKLYHQELNYNFLNCNLIKEEYLMAENLLQRLEAFMGKSALLYEKRAMLNYKLNRMTLAMFDVESALSLDRRHGDALYLKGLIFLREEDFDGAIQSIVEANRIQEVFSGSHFFLALGSREETVARVRPELTDDPSDELIELLETGIKRRFDKIREALGSVLDRRGVDAVAAGRSMTRETADRAAHDVETTGDGGAPEPDARPSGPEILEELNAD